MGWMAGSPQLQLRTRQNQVQSPVEYNMSHQLVKVMSKQYQHPAYNLRDKT